MSEAGAPAQAADSFFGGALRLRQPVSGHRIGTDAILLAAAIAMPEGALIDAGAGVGAVGLMMATRAPALDVTLTEIDPLTAALARENVALNGLDARARVIEADILSAKARRAAGLADRCADIIVTNPPWLTPGRSRASPDQRRALAHMRGEGGLTAWMRAVAALARPDACMAIILRGEDLRDLLEACAGRFGDLAILPVHPRAGEAATRIVATGRKGSRAPPRLMPGLVLHGADGRFTPRAEAMQRGSATLGLI